MRFRQLALRHADTAMTAFVRRDGSVNHIVEFYPYEGGVVQRRHGMFAVYGRADIRPRRLICRLPKKRSNVISTIMSIGAHRSEPRDVEDSAGHASNILTSPPDRPDRHCSSADIVRAVRDYILGHLGDGLSLDELGGIVHLHPVYLSKLYKQETGENLSSYILRARLEKSAHLLEVSHLHVMDIARMVGYRKPQYFIKLFKELYGITPYQYRRQRIAQSFRTDG
ncbi:helix-turn-helix transcriptional regulator [Paenibacillus sp. NPDC093718]|uniref:helix-turn-helix transcriptional regulator n=1 Tax=Paenibacillus sp. NPDC093718 TaxID=3390601 RepID=UPI003D070EAE